MPGNQPLPNGLEILQAYQDAASQAQAYIVLHSRNGAGASVDGALANSINTIIQNAFTSSGLAGHIVPTINLGWTRIRDMSSTENAWYGSTGGAVPGTAVNATPVPGAVSLCVSGSTGKRGASFRSRTYLWGYSVAAIAAGGGVLQDAADDSVTFMNTIRTGMAGLPQALPLVVVSRWTTPPGTSTAIERVPPIMTDIIAFASKDLVWDTQRRRARPGV